MNIQLDENLINRLQEFARQQQRPVNDIVAEAVARYINQQTDDVNLRKDIRQIMQEHDWLLDELSRR